MLLHFSFVCIYATNTGQKKSKISYYSAFYTYPYFHQNWNLFVPPPGSNYNLIVYNDSIKMDIFSEILTKHQTNRLAGYEPLLIALSNSIHYFEKNTMLKNGKVQNDKNFTIIEHFAKNYLAKKKIHSFKLIMLTSDLLTKKTRYYYN